MLNPSTSGVSPTTRPQNDHTQLALVAPHPRRPLRRLACWLESRGWLYWTHSAGHSTRAGSAMLQLNQLIDPSKRHLIELRTDRKTERDAAGDK